MDNFAHPLNGFQEAVSPVQDATSRLLRMLSSSVSRMSIIMRRCIGRERDRQRAFREINGIPTRSRIPYVQQPLTDGEMLVAAVCESEIRDMFGDGPADYAKDRFWHSLSTGDMRGFKIRLIFIKVRDSLVGSPIHSSFLAGIEDAITKAEDLAGCKPDPTPRRMSRFEKARKLRILAQKEAKERQVQELPLEWPEEAKTVENPDLAPAKNNDNNEDGAKVHQKNAGDKSRPIKALRKAREYQTVGQILEDIESGAIVRYESTDEIKADLKEGRLTPVEALMFTTAMGFYSHRIKEQEEDEEIQDESEDGDEGCVDADVVEDEDSDEVEDSDEEEDDLGPYEIEPERIGTSFSYNPRGFCGIGGRGSATGDWDRDDW